MHRRPKADEQERAHQGQEDDDDQRKKNQATRLVVAHALILATEGRRDRLTS
jgi:hypothetical protein